jgi:hypothetical protein
MIKSIFIFSKITRLLGRPATAYVSPKNPHFVHSWGIFGFPVTLFSFSIIGMLSSLCIAKFILLNI